MKDKKIEVEENLDYLYKYPGDEAVDIFCYLREKGLYIIVEKIARQYPEFKVLAKDKSKLRLYKYLPTWDDFNKCWNPYPRNETKICGDILFDIFSEWDDEDLIFLDYFREDK